MARFAVVLLLLELAICGTSLAVRGADFRFANYYGDRMVLQRGPRSASVWGYIATCSPVDVSFDGKAYTATIIKGRTSAEGCKWVVTLPPMNAGGPFNILASSAAHDSISLMDVLFGDVWICSGQSNMQFTLPQVYNAADEINKANSYPQIRLFTAALEASDTPTDELIKVEQPWSAASAASVNGSDWTYFSAACWLFGRDLYDHLQIPIGLVDTDWGGTPVEAWSSPDALSNCYKSDEQLHRPHSKAPDPHSRSVLWNSMIHPFLNMSIFGAIWYQGEANAGQTNYNCTFPAMIDDWRAKWFEFSRGQTDTLFPFGFVQLAADGNSNASVGGFPIIRWAQTADYGYVPNARMKKVFMAVAMDLGDPLSPFGSVHPRDKQDVGSRLALAGRAIAYGDTSVYYTGPIAKDAKISYTANSSLVELTISFNNMAPTGGLELRYPYGFELGCTSGTAALWLEGTATKVAGSDIIVSMPTCGDGMKPSQVRYCWRTDPCTFKMCPIYSGDLPAPPFLMPLA